MQGEELVGAVRMSIRFPRIPRPDAARRLTRYVTCPTCDEFRNELEEHDGQMSEQKDAAWRLHMKEAHGEVN